MILIILFIIFLILNQLLNSTHNKEMDENISIIINSLEELDKKITELKNLSERES